MAKFIKLTLVNNDPIFINMDLVTTMIRDTNWTNIWQIGNDVIAFLDKDETTCPFHPVRETPEEIIEMLNK